MPNRPWISPVLIVALVAGCSGSSPGVAPPLIGPHGGTLIQLPGQLGFAELLDLARGTRKGSGQAQALRQVVAYFLGPDLKAPAAVSATGVIVTLTIVTGQPDTVTLDPAAEPGDPLGKNRFASKPGPYDLSKAHAEFAANLDGQPFRAELDGAR